MKRISLVLLPLLGLMVGCGDEQPKLVPVTGQVTLNGKPLMGKTLRFVPEADTPGQGGGATTDQNGNYTLLAVQSGATEDLPGVAPGSYRVVVTEPMFPIDLPVQDSGNSDADPAPAIGLPSRPRRGKQVIPTIYGDQAQTPLQVTVPEEGGVLNLEVLSSGQRGK